MGMTSREFALVERAGIICRDKRVICHRLIIRNRRHRLLAYITGQYANESPEFQRVTGTMLRCMCVPELTPTGGTLIVQ